MNYTLYGNELAFPGWPKRASGDLPSPGFKNGHRNVYPTESLQCLLNDGFVSSVFLAAIEQEKQSESTA